MALFPPRNFTRPSPGPPRPAPDRRALHAPPPGRTTPPPRPPAGRPRRGAHVGTWDPPAMGMRGWDLLKTGGENAIPQKKHVKNKIEHDSTSFSWQKNDESWVSSYLSPFFLWIIGRKSCSNILCWEKMDEDTSTWQVGRIVVDGSSGDRFMV